MTDRAVSDQDRERGARVRALRAARGVTQDAIAEKMAVKRERISKMESGLDKLETLAAVVKLASALDVGLEPFVRYLQGDLSLEALLSPALQPAPLTVSGPNAALVELVAHLRARDEDLAVIAQVEALGARHSAMPPAELLAMARARVQELDETLGTKKRR